MNKKFMLEAIKEARKGFKAGHGGPFGAVIVKNGKIIAKDHNHVLQNNDCTCHAEMCVIRKACKKLKSFDLSGCEIYATGYPCPMCASAIQWSNIKKVYYAAALKDTTKIGFRDEQFYKNPIKPIQVGREEILKIYKEFMTLKKRRMY